MSQIPLLTGVFTRVYPQKTMLLDVVAVVFYWNFVQLILRSVVPDPPLKAGALVGGESSRIFDDEDSHSSIELHEIFTYKCSWCLLMIKMYINSPYMKQIWGLFHTRTHLMWCVDSYVNVHRLKEWDSSPWDQSLGGESNLLVWSCFFFSGWFIDPF